MNKPYGLELYMQQKSAAQPVSGYNPPGTTPRGSFSPSASSQTAAGDPTSEWLAELKQQQAEQQRYAQQLRQLRAYGVTDDQIRARTPHLLPVTSAQEQTPTGQQAGNPPLGAPAVAASKPGSYAAQRAANSQVEMDACNQQFDKRTQAMEDLLKRTQQGQNTWTDWWSGNKDMAVKSLMNRQDGLDPKNVAAGLVNQNANQYYQSKWYTPWRWGPGRGVFKNGSAEAPYGLELYMQQVEQVNQQKLAAYLKTEPGSGLAWFLNGQGKSAGANDTYFDGAKPGDKPPTKTPAAPAKPVAKSSAPAATKPAVKSIEDLAAGSEAFNLLAQDRRQENFRTNASRGVNWGSALGTGAGLLASLFAARAPGVRRALALGLTPGGTAAGAGLGYGAAMGHDRLRGQQNAEHAIKQELKKDIIERLKQETINRAVQG